MTVSIGVIFASIEQKTQDVLSYLITYQNTLQNSFQFRLMSYADDDDRLLNLLQRKLAPTHREAAADAKEFAARVNASCAEEADSYGLRAEHVDKVVLLTDTRFRDNFYYVESSTWAIAALGGWQREMAPPSIVEYYLNILVTSSLDA